MAAFALASPGPRAETLESELELLIRQNPRILADRERIYAAGEGVRGANAAFLPRAALNADTGVENISSNASRATRQDKPQQRDQVSVTLTQNLFDAGRKIYVKREAEINRAAAEIKLEATTQELVLSGIEAYIDVLARAYIADITLINEDAIRHQVELETKKLAVGAGTEVDVALARSRLQIAQERRVVALNDFEIAQIRYAQVFDRKPNVGAFAVPVPPLRLLPISIDEAIDSAVALHPEIATSERQIDVARARQRTTSADFFPRVDLVGRSSYSEDLDTERGPRREWSVLLQATWDIFSGFARQSASSQAAFTYNASLFDRESTARKVKEQVRVQWTSLRTACERVVLLRSALDIASQVEESRLKLRAAGRATDIDVLDSQTQTFNTISNMVAGITDGMKTVYRLLAATGRLDFDAILKDAAVPIDADLELPGNQLIRCDPARRNPFELKLDSVRVLRASLAGEDDQGAPSPRPVRANPFDAPRGDAPADGAVRPPQPPAAVPPAATFPRATERTPAPRQGAPTQPRQGQAPAEGEDTGREAQDPAALRILRDLFRAAPANGARPSEADIVDDDEVEAPATPPAPSGANRPAPPRR